MVLPEASILKYWHRVILNTYVSCFNSIVVKYMPMSESQNEDVLNLLLASSFFGKANFRKKKTADN